MYSSSHRISTFIYSSSQASNFFQAQNIHICSLSYTWQSTSYLSDHKVYVNCFCLIIPLHGLSSVDIKSKGSWTVAINILSEKQELKFPLCFSLGENFSASLELR